MKRKFLLGVGLSFLIAGCSSSQKIETSLNGKYFEADESELVDNLSKSISNDFKPEIIEEKGGKYLTLNSIDEKDGYTAIVMETNSIDKVEHILINTYVENPSADINEFEKKYLIDLPSQLLASFDVEDPERMAEACYSDMIDTYHTNGEIINDGIKLTCHSIILDDGKFMLSSRISPENAELN
ncbi:hypothetical protein [uncultured Dubosiella sp.]|uniref:hypothetical protein n=1 Tax=uncultured Dubosiella sp. TaxID=1937011 RepID=UPI002732266E|nr:hypothetical protein [uncultured Dubosiella sp.]